MQKDIHFYLTYALALKAGVPAAEAEKVAWADQYTDDLTQADLHGIQTQSAIIGNWADRQVQLSVLVPFHFVPGSNTAFPWMTTPNNRRSRQLVTAGAANSPFQLGIALHALQDTFSHQTFSGWQEDLNSCYPWYYVESVIPNVGHAELRVTPDVVNYIWTDPRDGSRVDNKIRARRAAKATYEFLAKSYGRSTNPSVWRDLSQRLQKLFKLTSYDKRVDGLCAVSGNKQIDYNEVNARLEPLHKAEFIQAARNHLSKAMTLFRNLPSAK